MLTTNEVLKPQQVNISYN